MKQQSSEFTKTAYEVFVDNTKNNLHVLFCTSPVGKTLRLRCRKFPSLINSCTLDWFDNWPEEALFSCCTNKLIDVDMEKENKLKISNLAVKFHIKITELAERYKSEVNKQVYVTPKSFLDLIDLFIKLLGTKKSEFKTKIVNF